MPRGCNDLVSVSIRVLYVRSCDSDCYWGAAVPIDYRAVLGSNLFACDVNIDAATTRLTGEPLLWISRQASRSHKIKNTKDAGKHVRSNIVATWV